MALPIVPNVAKGRVVELYYRVKNNSPSGCALWLIPCLSNGTEATVLDQLTVAAAISVGGIGERTSGGWVRKKLVAADLAAFPGPVTASDYYGVAIPAVTWTTPATGNNTTSLLIAYDPTGSSADSALIPLGQYAFINTTDGHDVVLNAGDFFRAS